MIKFPLVAGLAGALLLSGPVEAAGGKVRNGFGLDEEIAEGFLLCTREGVTQIVVVDPVTDTEVTITCPEVPPQGE